MFFWHHPPIALYDDAAYVQLALQSIGEADQHFLHGHNFSTRLAVFVPSGLIIKLFGLSRYTAHVWYALAFLLSMWAVWYYAKALKIPHLFWVLAITSFHPLILNNIHAFPSDVLVAAFCAAAIFSFFHALEHGNMKSMLVAAFALLLAYFTKASVFIIVLAMGLSLFIWRKQLNIRWFFMFSACVLISILVAWGLGLAPWDRIGLIEENLLKPGNRHWLNGKALWGFMTKPAILLGIWLGLITAIFLAFTSVPKIVKGFIVILVLTVVYLLFGSVSLSHYDPIWLYTRFWSIALLPAIVLVSYSSHFSKWRKLLLAFILLGSMVINSHLRYVALPLSIMVFLPFIAKKPSSLLAIIFILSIALSAESIYHRQSDIKEAQVVRNLDINSSLYIDDRLFFFRRMAFEDQFPPFSLKSLSAEIPAKEVLYWHNASRHQHLISKPEYYDAFQHYAVKDTLKAWPKKDLFLLQLIPKKLSQ